MIRRKLKVAITSFLLGILFAASATTAFAAYASSPYYNYGPVLGYSYKNEATVYNGSGAYAGTYVQTQDLATVPTGYIGIWAGLYDSSGQCVESSGNWAYNSQPLAGMSILSSTTYNSGTYTSKGYSAAYNGNGYSGPYQTYTSPALNY
ncbi:hypothetical protein [Desulfosporosinus sp. OT]|uniref:hypothetical protein n=1 Tax=Desulfosporosinus sp. OT TaxID=913865 RepID=UPI000223A2E7|nr:hypothetical protein [Desulfosporosinus sp. OT]EGW38524.1 hypothetical protein DOT_3587 [Desulfosporosinus sp. OT]